MPNHTPPSITETAFDCPNCKTFSRQRWYQILAHDFGSQKAPVIDERMPAYAASAPSHNSLGLLYGTLFLGNAHIAKCDKCDQFSYWIGCRLIYPLNGTAPPPNPDLPDEIRKDYEEASSILELSPRGAAALIRLCIQKLRKHLGQSGENINNYIAALVKVGLDQRIQKALDAVRVIGNNAVHPGQIDIAEDIVTATALFGLLNLIVEK